MSIPDYRTFFRCCAAFLLAGVLAAGHAAAQQEGAPAAVPEQVQEPAPEQPQAEPDHSEMDTVIMALCHEITILKKNEEKRMAIREALVKEADATYNYFDTRVYEMSAVLYALDDQKIFTLAFYCKAATSLVKTYYAQRPDFQGQEERLDKEIGRIKKLAESLEEVNTDSLSEPSLVQRDEALYTCRTLEESLLKEKEQISYLKELFNSLGGKIDALNNESGKLFTSLFNRVFYTPSNAARYIFLKPLKTYEICMGAWETSADSKLQLPSDPETLKHYGLILLGIVLPFPPHRLPGLQENAGKDGPLQQAPRLHQRHHYPHRGARPRHRLHAHAGLPAEKRGLPGRGIPPAGQRHPVLPGDAPPLRHH